MGCIVSVLRTTLYFTGILLCVALVLLLALPWVLAAVAWLRWRVVVGARRQRRSRTTTRGSDEPDVGGAPEPLPMQVCTGRVWHARFHPVRHAFTYPLFICCVNLRDDTDDDRYGNDALWPLSWIARFCEDDHLKNGEGLVEGESSKGGKADRQPSPSLLQRVFRLLRRETSGVEWNSHQHEVYLLTHLRYYGYCFNPVSFYGIFDRKTRQLEAVIGEVSNTPWGEMHCYVLHPSNPSVQVTKDAAPTTRYVFPKEFHVSPFMEMEYLYDWAFDWTRDRMDVTNSLLRQDASHTRQFHARMSARPTDASSPSFSSLLWSLARQVSFYPVHGMLLQLWIHYQALLLFTKGVEFRPHPRGSETAASRWIGYLAAPLFALRGKGAGRGAAPPPSVQAAPKKHR